MRPFISVNEVSKAFGSIPILNNSTFDIFEMDRIGLVGHNGVGKTTLLRLITGEERPDMGDIDIKPGLQIGSLTQYLAQNSDETVAENLRTSDYLASVRGELGAIEARMTDPEFYGTEGYEDIMSRYGELQATLGKFEGERFVSRALGLLAKLGLEPDLEQPIATLSGGERRKLALAKLLVASSDLDMLLLDEPTNHLDIGTIEWLEEFLSEYRGSIVIVSHDRYLLDDTVDRIFEIEDTRLRTYAGGYTDYVEQKQAFQSINMKAYKKYVNEVKRNRAIIQKLKGRNRFDAQIKSRLKQMDKMERVEDSVIREKVVKFKFKEAGVHSRRVIDVENMAMGFGERTFFRRANFEVERGDRIGVIGPNGCGKTTLLKLLLGEEKPTAGKLDISRMAKMGYFDQGHLSLDPENDLIEELQSLDSTIHEFDAKALLGRFLFKGDMMRYQVKKLSGGEKARLAILKLVLSPCNLLLLDEPTNHLDIPAQQVVAAALNSYKGTVLIISHDRYFLDSVANKILNFAGDSLELHTGNYTTYLTSTKRRSLEMEGEVRVRYAVEKGFTDWSTGQRYKIGEMIDIPNKEREKFRWALEAGNLVPEWDRKD